MTKPAAAVLFALMIVCAGCAKTEHKDMPTPGQTLLKGGSRPRAAQDERRELFAQIVDESIPESAIIEGKPYKWFLKACAANTHDSLRKSSKEEVLFDSMMAQPGLFRGQVVTLTRGVIIEVSRAPLPPEYGLPGYSVLPAIFVDSTHDVYALRILCPPESKLYDKLAKGIEDDQYPVMRMSGYFMKLYARRTAKKDESPWQRPLLICPEPEFSQAIDARSLWAEFQEGKVFELLPSERIDAPGAEERMLVQVTTPKQGAKEAGITADGEVLNGDMKEAMAKCVAEFKKRLAKNEQDNPAAVILMGPGAPREPIEKIVPALRAAGVKRLAIKREQ